MIQILALSGGGFRGLYTATVLARLEAEFQRPIAAFFDLSAGTSIGGILALAAAFEIPMSNVVDAFVTHGSAVFPRSHLLSGLVRSRYNAEPLRKLVDAIFPEGALLGHAKHAVVIPAINLTTGKHQILKTRHNREWTRDYRYSVADVACATSAAPIYFPISELDQQMFCDGGLVANAPDLVALHEANTFLDREEGQIRMLSVGTLSSSYSLPASTSRSMGVLNWLRVPTMPLIQTVLGAQQQFAIQLVRHRLGDQHYMRIDSQPSDAVMRDVGLDKADAAAQRTLKGLANKDVTDVLGRDVLRNFFTHTPKRWIVDE